MSKNNFPNKISIFPLSNAVFFPKTMLPLNIFEERYIQLVKDCMKEEKMFGIEKLNLKRSQIPAVTHVDYSARIQTVSKETNLKYFKLITKFKEITGCPIIINTSFNVRGEPIVNTPEDAFKCFMGTELDSLVIENCYLDKKDQDPKMIKSYKNKFKLD